MFTRLSGPEGSWRSTSFFRAWIRSGSRSRSNGSQRLEISIQQNVLTVSGERKISAENKATYRQERFSGEFRRAITLPEDVAVDGVDARYRDGVLQISVPRREQARPRQIQVREP